jgi:hypothetical protein
MLFIGMLYFAWTNNIILIRYPFSPQPFCKTNTKSISKKKAVLFFWHNDMWNKEEVDLIWSTDMTKNIHYLINSWLNLLEEEDINEKRISVESVAIHDHKAYISFDRNPFDKNKATFDKWLWIEGLLKTIRENNVPLQEVQFLAHHKIVNDYHLDFSNSWPINGFFEK